jgi:hypothetical protein
MLSVTDKIAKVYDTKGASSGSKLEEELTPQRQRQKN